MAAREGLTAEQAGKVLGVTGSRVRQLVRAGKLDGWDGDDKRTWVDSEQVRALARERRAGRARTSSGSGASAVPTDLESILVRVLDQVLPRALESATADLRRELDAERDARVKAEREAARWRAKAERPS